MNHESLHEIFPADNHYLHALYLCARYIICLDKSILCDIISWLNYKIIFEQCYNYYYNAELLHDVAFSTYFQTLDNH